MKTLALSVFTLLVIVALGGAPLRDAPTEIVQPDGSKYACFMSGDEYYHRFHDAGGYTILKDHNSGWYYYARREGPDLVPTEFIPGKDDPAARGLQPNLLPDESVLRQRFQLLRGSQGDNYGRAPTSGTIENIVVFVRFMGDPEFTDPVQLYNDMHNSSLVPSLKGYFLEESGNQLSANSTFFPVNPGMTVISYQDAFPRNYYYPQTPANPTGYPPGPAADPDRFGWIRLHTMFATAVNFIAPTVPPGLNIDADTPPDNCVDNISFICRGNADAASALFWPHSWQLTAYAATPVAFIPNASGPKQAVDYNLMLQLPDPLFPGWGGIDASIVCHEFSHTLGFPDLYHYTPDGVNPCGYWDLMDTCQGVPQHHLTYMKWKYGGWFAGPPPLPAPGSTASLNPVATNPFACYRYLMPTGEEIWIEYRKQTGLYEQRVPGSGLIAYRVDQAYFPFGNAGGPPDEVYVYRPGVTPALPDGMINQANFAWEVLRTAVNLFTDPKPASQITPVFVDPAFNLHSISSNTAAPISFEVGTAIPVIWTGLIDTNWFNPGNWSSLAVPLATDFVIVAGSLVGNTCTVMPGPLAVCQNIRVEAQFQLLPGSVLNVGGWLYSIGQIVVDGTLQVSGNMTIDNWYAGSLLQSMANPAAQVNIGGNCLWAQGANVNMPLGTLRFSNLGVTPPVTYFTNDSAAVINNLVINKGGTTLNYNPTLPAPLFLNGSLTVTLNSTFIISTQQVIIVSGNINVLFPGVLQANMGAIVMQPATPGGGQVISIQSPASYLNDLDITGGSATMLASSLAIRGNFNIWSGTFAANANTLSLSGNWNNQAGLGGFIKGTSRVVFCGSPQDQNIVVGATLPGGPTENFYILELNKAAGSLTLNTAGQMTLCDFYDWTSGLLKVTDGNFTANSLLDGYIAGNIVCNAPGMMSLTDTAGFGDLGANLSLQGGTLSVFAPAAPAGSNSTWGILSGSLNMNSGVLRFWNTGVSILPGMAFSSSVTGGSIEVNGDFLVQRPEFAPTGGTVRILGTGPANVGTSAGSLFDLVISATPVSTTFPLQISNNLQTDPGCGLQVSQNVNVGNGVLIMGSLSASAGTLDVANNIVVPAGGNLALSGGVTLNTGGQLALTGGSLQSNGAAGNLATLQGRGAGYWQLLTTTGSNLSVNYTQFRKLTGAGVNVANGATVSLTADFDYCVFRDGAANSTFLTVNNNQSLVIDGISFPTVTPGTSYNIAKTVNAGSILVNSSSGAFAGPVYERDPNGRISWNGYPPNLVVQSFTVSNASPYVKDLVNYAVTVYNNSPYFVPAGFNVHLFKHSSAPPAWTAVGDYQLPVPALNPYQTHTVNFTGVTSATAGNWTSWALIDPEGTIAESNEYDNNLSTGVAWLGLPAVGGITFTLTGANTARIAWTYPIWVSRYDIYDCATPYGTFTYLGTTTNQYYDVTLSSGMRYYRVVAVRI